MISRRGFFGVLAGVLVAATAAPKARKSAFDLLCKKMEQAKSAMLADLNRQLFSDDFGTIGGINRATFSFWRNADIHKEFWTKH